MPDSITIFVASLPAAIASTRGLDAIGYGRTPELARANAGWDDATIPGETLERITFRNESYPCLFGPDNSTSLDYESGPDDDDDEIDCVRTPLAWEICQDSADKHAVPEHIRLELRSLLRYRQFASAIDYCAKAIWEYTPDDEDEEYDDEDSPY